CFGRFCLFWLFTAVSVVSLQYTEDCRADMYPPNGPTFKGDVAWYTVDLDSPPNKRWTAVISDKKKDVSRLQSASQ
uniref:Acid ceramidase N-terminal domain-containing protein n=1 Tax=Kryptolebias marmoratus TaxID=37003 RepID=A0A3Q2ZWT1_KRYMA